MNNIRRLAFIGGGNMAAALIGGLIKRGLASERVVVADPSQEQLQKLIREGATLVETAGDVLSELRIPLCPQGVTGAAVPGKDVAGLDKEYEMLLDAFGFEPATLDVLAARSGLPGESIASMLLILELEGCVAALPGGRYDRIL